MATSATHRPLPTDADELHAVAVSAAVWLRIDAARKYGFIKGGPGIDVARCEEALAQARDNGIEPTADEINACAAAIIADLIQPDAPAC